MDERTQEEIDAKRKRLRKGFTMISTTLLKEETRLKATVEVIRKLKIGGELGDAIVRPMEYIGDLIGLINSLTAATASWGEGTLETMEESMHQQVELKKLTASTENALTALNNFVERYTPLLEELESQRGFRRNIEGEKRP